MRAPFRHNRGDAAATNKSRADDNGHHRDNADHPYKLYEIARVSTIWHFSLLRNTLYLA